MILRERLRTSSWSGNKKMTNILKVEKEKENVEWQLASDIQEKKLLEGMQDICNKIGENLKKFLHSELDEIRGA